MRARHVTGPPFAYHSGLMPSGEYEDDCLMITARLVMGDCWLGELGRDSRRQRGMERHWRNAGSGVEASHQPCLNTQVPVPLPEFRDFLFSRQ